MVHVVGSSLALACSINIDRESRRLRTDGGGPNCMHAQTKNTLSSYEALPWPAASARLGRLMVHRASGRQLQRGLMSLCIHACGSRARRRILTLSSRTGATCGPWLVDHPRWDHDPPRGRPPSARAVHHGRKLQVSIVRERRARAHVAAEACVHVTVGLTSETRSRQRSPATRTSISGSRWPWQ